MASAYPVATPPEIYCSDQPSLLLTESIDDLPEPITSPTPHLLMESTTKSRGCGSYVSPLSARIHRLANCDLKLGHYAIPKCLAKLYLLQPLGRD
jgi:hypothetical protein